MIKRRTLSKIFDGQVWNTDGAIFATGEVKQLKIPWVFDFQPLRLLITYDEG